MSTSKFKVWVYKGALKINSRHASRAEINQTSLMAVSVLGNFGNLFRTLTTSSIKRNCLVFNFSFEIIR